MREPRKGKAVTGRLLEQVKEDRERRRPVVSFTFTKEGGDLLYELTSENKPSGSGVEGFKRQLAIVVDGQVVTAPRLVSPIRTRGQITGDFTLDEVKALVKVMRSDIPKQHK
jgi:preprotein translocase subunit SecD